MIPFLLPQPSADAARTPVLGTSAMADSAARFAELLDGMDVVPAPEEGAELEGEAMPGDPRGSSEEVVELQEDAAILAVGVSEVPSVTLCVNGHADTSGMLHIGRGEVGSIRDASEKIPVSPQTVMESRAKAVFAGALTPDSTGKAVVSFHERAIATPEPSITSGPQNTRRQPSPPVVIVDVSGGAKQPGRDPPLRQETPLRVAAAAPRQQRVAPPVPIAAALQHDPLIAFSAVRPDAPEGAFAMPPDRAAQPPSAPQLQAQAPHLETARQVAAQVAVAVTERAGRPTEIALNPEELGRVRLSMSAVDTSITLNVSAERQETSELLRRHIETLAQEFKDLGYNDISFSFEQNSDAPDADSEHALGAGDQLIDTDEPVAPQTIHLVANGGLDIKL